MYYISEAYDDYSAGIAEVEIASKSRLVTEKNLIKLNDVIGLTVHEDDIAYLTAYNRVEFESEQEADDCLADNNVSNYLVFETSTGVVVLIPKSDMIHVYYMVGYFLGCTDRMDCETYLGENGGYTNNKRAAKVFKTRAEAEKTAAVMRAKSKTGKLWKAVRVEVRHED